MNLFTIAALTGTSEAVSNVGLKLGLVEPSWTFVFQIANTLILFLLLKHFLFKPVTEHLRNRQESIENSLQEAEDKNLEADQMKTLYSGKISVIKQEGNEIINEMKKVAEKEAKQIIKSAVEDARKFKEKTEKELEREKEKTIQLLKDEVSEIALQVATKVIEKDLSGEDHKRLVQEFIVEVGDSEWQN
jgi:F-type H+-transporting ATPase subunit b